MDTLSRDPFKEIECPVCLELMVPPIFQCKNGHNTCWTCRQNIIECPICRGELSELRNFEAENLSKSVSHDCKFGAFGCTRKYLLNEKEQHESICPYRHRRCPLFYLSSCTAEVDPSDAREHIEEEHTVIVINKDNTKTTSHTEPSSYRNVFIHKSRGPVVIDGEMFISVDELANEFHHVCYMYVGAIEDARKYKYKITASSFKNNNFMSVCCQCPSYLEVLERGGIESIPHAIIPDGYKEECSVDEKYYFQVEIWK